MRRFAIVSVIVLATAVFPAAAEHLKIATLAPDGSFWMKEAREAAAEIAERTDRRVTFRFYPGGTMGDDAAVMRKMRIGQLHGGVFLTGSLAAVAPDINIYTLPLLFRNYDEVDAVRTAVDPKLMLLLEAGGYHSFGLIEGGFAYLYTTSKAATFDDLKGRKAWLPEDDPIGKVLIREAGLTPVPLGLSDVLTGLQTGLVDVVSGPPVGAVALQWFTKVRYVTDIPLVYTSGTFTLSQRSWSRLSPADQLVVDEVLSRMTRTLDARAREDNEGAWKALENQGVITVTPTAETTAQWQQLAARCSTALVDELDLNTELLDEIDSILDGIRSTE